MLLRCHAPDQTFVSGTAVFINFGYIAKIIFIEEPFGTIA